MNVLSLSFRDLEGVASVAAHAHFGRAAAALGIAQPTLSSQVQRVERALGVTLFERTARRFLITPDGERVLPMVREMLDAARRLGSVGAERGAGAPLRLGVIPTLGPYLVPHLLPPLKRQGHLPRVSLSEHPTSVLVDMLREGSLDAALLSLPIRDEAIESIGLFDEPFRLIAPRGSDLLKATPLVASLLRARDMVLLSDGHCLREQALSLCGRRGGSAPRLVTTSLETLKYLVASGEGYSLLPLLACEIPPALRELVEVRSFDGGVPTRRIGLCFRRSFPRRESMAALAAFLRENRPAGLTLARSAAFPRSGVRCERC